MTAYIIDNNKLIKTSDPNILDRLYYLEITIPNEHNLKKLNINKSKEFIIDNIKKVSTIASKNDKIALYDIINTNIHLINKDDVYTKVIYDHYRYPEKHNIKNKHNELTKLLSGNKNIDDRPIKERTLRKLSLTIDFLSCFDEDIMYDTYLHAFYYSNPAGWSITQCLRKSFMPYYKHLKPFYEKEEIIKLAYNMKLVDKNKMSKIIDDEQLNDLCNKVKLNDISHEILTEHQKHIVKHNSYGLVQYFTFHGSYSMNKYLRGLMDNDYRNIDLESNIDKMNNLIRSAPKFDKDYVLYRFIRDDSPINKLKIGDVFVPKGFVSTTRDPFYDPKSYSFGFVLVKIKIPKDIQGVALSVETVSLFPTEQELIIPPQCRLRLIAKNTNVNYHTLDKYQSLIDMQYEFEFIGFTNDKLYNIREPIDHQYVNFLEIEKIISKTVAEKINYFVNNYVNEINQFITTINGENYTIIAEWYNSTGVYRDFYAAKTSNGFSLYNIHNGDIQFMIEIGESEKPYIYVNYHRKLSAIQQEIVTTYDNQSFLTFIASIAYFFNISTVIIYADYISCDYSNGKKSYRGGNYCIDFYQYLKHGKKNFSYSTKNRKQNRIGIDEDISIPNYDAKILKRDRFSSEIFDGEIIQRKREHDSVPLQIKKNNLEKQIIEIKPVFSYYLLDKLEQIKPSTIITRDKRDDILYQVFKTVYKKDDNLKLFYVWLVENYCYLLTDLIDKLGQLFPFDNPFEHDYYTFNAIEYLYNRRKIMEYPVTDAAIRFINKNRNRISDDTRFRS